MVERRGNRESGDGANAWCRHEQSCDRMDLGDCGQLSIKYLDLVEHSRPCVHQRLDQSPYHRRGLELTGHEFTGASAEPTDGFAEQHSEGAQQTSNLVLKLDPDVHQGVACSK